MRVDSAPDDSPWQRQRDASDRLSDDMMKFARREFPEAREEAWMDFNQTLFAPSMDKFEGEHQIFVPYFLFDWHPNPPRKRRGRPAKPGIVAQDYFARRGSRLSELELMILQESLFEPVSFYEVMESNPGHGMVLRDLLIGGECEVEEHSGSTHAKSGDIVYAQICRLPEVNTLSRMAPLRISPGRKPEIVGLRVALRRKIAKLSRDLTAEDLIHYRDMIRGVYLDIRDVMHRPPKLCNTDGDPLVFHNLTFSILSALVAFDALAPLAWGQTKEELIEEAEIDADGTLRSATIEWKKKGNKMHAHWDSTIMGRLRISGHTLEVEVNSANRAKRITGEIEERLGMMATLKSTRKQTPEEAIQESNKRRAARDGGESKEEAALDPETQREFLAISQEETEAWVHAKIPVLGGYTPLEAVADPDGREIVEGLLLDWERRFEGPQPPGSFCPDVNAVRRLLNLPVPAEAR
ncbi:MAG: hypothetical protein WBE76_04780 [Terracidiphilus sp.]